jgi:hypothetical protein
MKTGLCHYLNFVQKRTQQVYSPPTSLGSLPELLVLENRLCHDPRSPGVGNRSPVLRPNVPFSGWHHPASWMRMCGGRATDAKLSLGVV